MNTDKFPFKKTFTHTGNSFSAIGAAEKWCREHDLGCGVMCADEPHAIMKGESHLPKWRNISLAWREKLDGVITSDDFRDGDVTVHLLEEP